MLVLFPLKWSFATKVEEGVNSASLFGQRCMTAEVSRQDQQAASSRVRKSISVAQHIRVNIIGLVFIALIVRLGVY